MRKATPIVHCVVTSCKWTCRRWPDILRPTCENQRGDAGEGPAHLRTNILARGCANKKLQYLCFHINAMKMHRRYNDGAWQAKNYTSVDTPQTGFERLELSTGY